MTGHDHKDDGCDTCKDGAEIVDGRIRARIALYGHTFIGVFDPEGVKPAFVYSIGLTNKDQPELLMIGNMRPDTCEAILGAIIEQWDRLGVFYGPITGVARTASDLDVPMMLRKVKADEALGGYAFAVPTFCPSTDGYAFVQVVWPDPNGKYPYDPGYDSRCKQPLLTEEE